MRRTIIYSALVALVLGLLTAAAPFPRTRGGGPVSSPRYDTLTTIIGTSPLTTRTAASYPAAIDDSNKVGVAWALPAAAASLVDSAGYGSATPSDCVLYAGNTIPNGYGGAMQPLLVMPYTKRADRDIVQALLAVYVDPSYPLILSAGDTLFVFADTVTADAALPTSIGQARWATSPLWPTRANATWNNIKSGVAWSPTLASRNSGRELGPYVAITAAATTSGWMAFDVTRLVDAHTVRAFGFVCKRASGNNAIRFGNPDDATKATRPFLLVKTFAKARAAGPWPGGKMLAACITQDDLESQAYTTHLVKLADSLGVKITLAPELGHIDVSTGVKSDSLLAYAARGHEIASQGWYSNLSNGVDKIPGDPDSTASLFAFGTFKTAVQSAAGIHVQMDSTRVLFLRWGLALPRTYVYPFGFRSAAYDDSLTARGIIAARGASIGSYADWIRVSADSCYPFRVPASYNPLGSASAGYLYQDTDTEAQVRAKVRALVRECLTRGSSRTEYDGVIVLFGHSFTDMKFNQLAWIIDELRLNGVYIDRFDNLMAYYRRHHHPPVLAGGHWLAY